jgi:hypothetical protein
VPARPLLLPLHRGGHGRSERSAAGQRKRTLV